MPAHNLALSAGYMCSHAADAYALTSGDDAATFLTDTTARCIPCNIGEYCPQVIFWLLHSVLEYFSLAFDD